MMRSLSVVLPVSLLITTTPACGLVGPSCLARQHKGTVATLTGDVAAGAIAVHRVAYGTDGSQNDVDISWIGQSDANGPRIKLYATKVDCDRFVADTYTGPCAIIGSASGFTDPTTGRFVQSSLTLTHGRGNPEVLGSPPEYKLWVVGDSSKNTSYRITITWFYGPDC